MKAKIMILLILTLCTSISTDPIETKDASESIIADRLSSSAISSEFVSNFDIDTSTVTLIPKENETSGPQERELRVVEGSYEKPERRYIGYRSRYYRPRRRLRYTPRRVILRRENMRSKRRYLRDRYENNNERTLSSKVKNKSRKKAEKAKKAKQAKKNKQNKKSKKNNNKNQRNQRTRSNQPNQINQHNQSNQPHQSNQYHQSNQHNQSYQHNQHGQQSNSSTSSHFEAQLPRLDKNMFINVFKPNKYLCIDQTVQGNKLCANRCSIPNSHDCNSCTTIFRAYTNPFCERSGLTSDDKFLYRQFKDNAFNCLVKETTCKNVCKRYCDAGDQNQMECANCVNGCPRAADASCLTGPQILTKYNGGIGVSKRIADVFGLQPILCLDTVRFCNDVCHDNCYTNRYAHGCTKCTRSCNESSGVACRYIMIDSSVRNHYVQIRADPMNCRKADTYCKDACINNCRAGRISPGCKNCWVQCSTAVEPACIVTNSFKSVYMNTQNKKIFNHFFYGMFKHLVSKCSNPQRYCNSYCETLCILGDNSYPCTSCKDDCTSAGIASCRNIRNDPLAATLFNYFHDNHMSCNEIKHSCVSQCKIRHCDRRNSYSEQCLQCHEHCDASGHAACDTVIKNIKETDRLFSDIQQHLSKQSPSIQCDKCYHEIKYVCSWKCGQNFKCSRICSKVAVKACYSLCQGDFLTYYGRAFNQKFAIEFSRYKVFCENCSSECGKECRLNCYSIDRRCNQQCSSICNRQCAVLNCEGNQNYYKRFSFSMKNSDIYFKNRFDVELGRLKLAQAARNEYDNILVHRMKRKVFRTNRDNLLDTIELGEDEIYNEQDDIANEQRNKAISYETKLMGEIKALYSKRETYKLHKESDLAIFED